MSYIKQTKQKILTNIKKIIKRINTQDIKDKFANEILLINGKLYPASLHKSILFFTVHKSASSYVNRILKQLVESTNIKHIDLDNYFRHFDAPPDTVRKTWKKAFNPNGYLYSALRYPDILEFVGNIEDYKILLMLRDPRDVITSAYFSFRYSHSLPKSKSRRQTLLINRDKLSKQSIDDYAIESINTWLNRYTYYCNSLLGRQNVKFVKYETMVSDFNTWLNTVIDFLEIDVDQETVNKITNKVDFIVKEENIYSHKRQVTPGDHKRKLKLETIEILNTKFSEVLELLDYEK